MRAFVKQQASTLLRRLAFHVHEAAVLGTPDAIHDLRTSIRRLSECLRTFAEFFPPGQAESTRGKLKRVMDLSSEVRNRDIARELFLKAGWKEDDTRFASLAGERNAAKDALIARLQSWRQHDFSHRWRGALKL